MGGAKINIRPQTSHFQLQMCICYRQSLKQMGGAKISTYSQIILKPTQTSVLDTQ